ncbi:MAG: hypothetical protein AB1540_06975 [Bdellovibrionota bacterium]
MSYARWTAFFCSLFFYQSVSAATQTSSGVEGVEPQKGVTTGQLESVVKKPSSTKRFGPSMALTSFFYGPAVDDVGAGTTPGIYEGSVDGLSLQNQVSLTFNPAQDLWITPVFDFVYRFTDSDGFNANEFALDYDSFIRIARTNIFNERVAFSNVGLNADVRVFFPTSEFSRDNRTIGSARFSLVPFIRTRDQKWSFNFLNYVKYWLQTEEISPVYETAIPQVMFYTGPSITYQFSQRVSAWLLFEATMAVNSLGEDNRSDPERSLVDIEPGFDLQITKNLYVSPYLNWYLSQPITTTSLNVIAKVVLF